MKLYAAITKSEPQDDGTLKVWGFASTEAVDTDGETITAAAMKAALPDYMKWGAVREMHQAKAAGTAIEARVDDDGRTYFGAHIVDSEAVKKVNLGVYKGFSIGGKVTKRDDLNKTIIHGLKLVEVSLVDRPANPEAVFTMFKAEDIPGEAAVDVLADLLNKGAITAERLVELAQASLLPASATDLEAVKKGMGNVSRLASLLRDVFWLVGDQLAERAREGDASTVPAALRDWLDAGGVILSTMVTEEVAEMMANVAPQDDGPGIYLAARAVSVLSAARDADVTKAGRALSSASMKHIQAIHDASASLGACGGMAAKASAVDVAKAVGLDGATAWADVLATVEKGAAAVPELSKLQAAHDEAMAAIGKAAGAKEGDVLATVVETLAKSASTALARVAELEAKPVPPKGALKAVAKGEDLGDPGATEQKVDPVRKSDGSTDDVATLIKSIHAGR